MKKEICEVFRKNGKEFMKNEQLPPNETSIEINKLYFIS
jgi:hypothetical protein